MNNVRIAEVFDLVADLLEFQDANPFRVRAYRNGARAVRDCQQQMQSILADPEAKLTDIAGLGKDLADKITTLCTTGTLPMLEELQAQVPQSVLALLRIPGLGPKKAAVLYNELKIIHARPVEGRLRSARKCANSRASAPRPRKPSWPA